MGKSNASANASGMYEAMASAQAAQQEYALGTQQLGFEQQQWAQDQPLIQQVANTDVTAQNQQDAFSSALQNDYTSTTLPLVNEFTNQAENWATPQQQNLNAGAAEASVADSMQASKSAAQEQLEGYGIDPSSTRYAALDYGYAAQQGAAQGAAGTTAIQNTKLQGLGLEQAAIEAGQGIAGTSVAASGAGTGAGSGASGSTTAGLSAASSAMAEPTAWFNSGANNMNTYTNAVNGFNFAQNQAASINNSAASGLGSLAGGIFGSIMPASGIAGLADGGPAIPMDAQTPGGAIPPQASPTQGQAIDDVPARLTAGEFVIPKDVVEWEGMKSMYGMIDKARQGSQKAGQRADVGGKPTQALPMPPAFISQPAQQAIPMGAH